MTVLQNVDDPVKTHFLSQGRCPFCGRFLKKIAVRRSCRCGRVFIDHVKRQKKER